MINIWDYQDATKVTVVDTEGRVFTGNIIELTEAEEESEDYGFGEDSISIYLDGKVVCIPQSEIKSIEVIEE